jgi:hypothetical protein
MKISGLGASKTRRLSVSGQGGGRGVALGGAGSITLLTKHIKRTGSHRSLTVYLLPW